MCVCVCVCMYENISKVYIHLIALYVSNQVKTHLFIDKMALQRYLNRSPHRPRLVFYFIKPSN
uniref:Uncharacterized protein n=1 Tax=Octopus bimaculoides TaxID=37653 RepID=A0A0L8GTM0_OCTBM